MPGPLQLLRWYLTGVCLAVLAGVAAQAVLALTGVYTVSAGLWPALAGGAAFMATFLVGAAPLGVLALWGWTRLAHRRPALEAEPAQRWAGLLVVALLVSSLTGLGVVLFLGLPRGEAVPDLLGAWAGDADSHVTSGALFAVTILGPRLLVPRWRGPLTGR